MVNQTNLFDLLPSMVNMKLNQGIKQKKEEDTHKTPELAPHQIQLKEIYGNRFGMQMSPPKLKILYGKRATMPYLLIVIYKRGKFLPSNLAQSAMKPQRK